MKKIKVIIPYLLFLMLLLIAFRKVLYISGMIGHTWDWGMPHFREQYIDKLKNLLFIWDDTIGGGRYLFFKFELFYWIITFPFSFLGAQWASKLIPITFLLFSAISMYKLCRYYGITSFWSSMAGVFYMFSPISYSRIIAGHLTVLLCYSLLPALLIYFQKIVDNIKSKKRISFADVFLTAIFLMAQILVHPMIIIAILVTIVFFGWYLLFGVHKWRLIKILSFVVLLVILMNSFWLLPAMHDYFSTRALGAGAGVNYAGSKQFTAEEELNLRKGYVRSTQQTVFNSVRIHSEIGMDKDYVWPLPGKWKNIWTITSLIFCFVFFVILFKKNSNILYIMIPYIILSILGVLLVSGYYTFIGKLIYGMLAKLCPLVYMDISRTPRMLVIICLVYALGIFYVLNDLERHIRRKWLLRSISICGLGIFILPFINGNMIKPLYPGSIQPHSLKVNKINAEDKLVYRFFKDNPEDFRLTYLPPVMMSWPGDTDLSYEWNVMLGLSPKPEFLGRPEMGSLSYGIAENMYSLFPSPYLGKLLGLANVKYIIYPDYKYFVSFKDFIPEYNPPFSVDGFKNYKPILDESLKKQEGFVKIDTNFDNVTIYENKWFLPHIYATENENLVFAEKDSFAQLSYRDCFSGRPAAIFIDNTWEAERLLRESMRGQKIDGIFATLSGKNITKEFYAPYSKDYIIQVDMKLNYISEDVIENVYPLGLISPEGILCWRVMPNMASYSCNLSNETGVIFNCYFDGKPIEDEFVRLKQEGLSMDLSKYPLLEMGYKVDDGRVQTIEVIALVDFNKDGIADKHINMGYDYPAAEFFYKHVLNIYGEAKKRFPNERYYDLIALELYLHKIWKTDCESKQYKGNYKFYLKNLQMVKYKTKVLIKSINNSPENIWESAEVEKRNWKISKIECPVQTEVLGKGVVFEKSSAKIEFSRKVNVDVSKYENISFTFNASPFYIKRIMLLIDLDKKKDFYITDLPVGTEMQNANINIYEYLANYSYPATDFIVKSVKFLIEEDTNKKYFHITEQDRKAAVLNRDSMFYINALSFYSAHSVEKLIARKPIIAIDDDIKYFGYKFYSGDNKRKLFIQYKTRLARGWHKFCWLLHPDEYFKLNWAMLSFDKNGKAEDVKTSLGSIFNKINPTKYIADITDAKKPFWLVFLENYHEGWRAYIKPKTKVQSPEKRHWWEYSAICTWFETRRMKRLDAHFEVNGYANGWWVNPPEINNSHNFEIIIVFKPQRYYELGIISAGLVMLGGFGIVLVSWFKRKD